MASSRLAGSSAFAAAMRFPLFFCFFFASLSFLFLFPFPFCLCFDCLGGEVQKKKKKKKKTEGKKQKTKETNVKKRSSDRCSVCVVCALPSKPSRAHSHERNQVGWLVGWLKREMWKCSCLHAWACVWACVREMWGSEELGR